jgi:hypothetical protein
MYNGKEDVLLSFAVKEKTGIKLNMELNEFGKRVWKHKTNKRLFLEQAYRWKDSLILLDETEGRQVVDSFVASTFDYSAWEPMTKEEYDSVVSNYLEIYSENNVKVFTKGDLQFLKGTSGNHINWIYHRLAQEYGVNPDYDYMIKLKEIADWVSKNI